MLHLYIEQFLHYCQVSNFPPKSLESVKARLKQFERYFQTLAVESISELTYAQLLAFVADFEAPSVHVRKNRLWALRHFYNFLRLNHIIDKNLASRIPYPKITRKVPRYLTMDEFKRILRHFCNQSNAPNGLRNLIVIMLFGFLGLRLRSVLRLDAGDIDLTGGLIRVGEKGNVERFLPLPDILLQALSVHLRTHEYPRGSPLLLSRGNKRLSARTVQEFLSTAMRELGIGKQLHAHLFRHTAATYLNKVAGPDVTQHVLGHATRRNTVQYTHLNPDVYAVYMKKHPYMNL